MIKKRVDGFEYILKKSDKIIGIVTESPTDYNMILKPKENGKRKS
jgi:hypothetical protein